MKNQPQIQIEMETETEIQFNPFSPEIERVIHTTNSQQEIWSDCLFGGSDANKAYNLSVSINFKGNLIIEIFERAVKTLIDRHEALRASFSPDGRFMCIYSDYNVKVSKNDLSGVASNEKESAIDKHIREQVSDLFDLVNGPLFRVNLLKIDEFETIATLTIHHIVGDGLSIDIILEELGVLYSAYIENKEFDLPAPEKFSEFAEKINSLMESSDCKPLEDFWIDIYKESVPTIELPLDFVRPSLRTYNSSRLDFSFDDDIISELKDIGIKSRSSLVTTLLAAFEIFLCKLTGQNDLVVGFPSSGNTLYGMKQLIGDCVNLLPLRSKINSDISFLDYLKQRNTQLFDAYEHQQVTFGHLLKSFAIARDPSRIPLVPVILTVDLSRTIEDDFSYTGLNHSFKPNPREYGTFEIQLHIFRAKSGPSFQWTYNTTLFKPETITKMMASFEEIIKEVIASPTSPLSEIVGGNYLADYTTLNSTEMAYPDVTLTELLRKQAEITPTKTAVEFHDIKTTYKELHEKVNQMAHYLKDQGVQSGDFIAVSFPRSPELVYALLAIMQCGAAYLPLDPDYPKERLEFMLTDSNARVLLTTKTLFAALPSWPQTLFIEDAVEALDQYSTLPLPFMVNSENNAYILYTSGSTGNPKGVPITHKNLVNFLCSMSLEPGIDENDRLLSITTISFDIAGLELYLPLMKGATLILADHETARDGRLLLDLVKKEKINFLQATPTTWSMLLDSGWSEKMPLKALCGGEAMPADLANELLSKCDSLWNVYGPTETTIWSSVKQIKAEDKLITIGKPIGNTQIYLIDNQGQLVAPGNIGEIVIGGDGVAKGYWNRPELSAEKFIPNKFSDKNEDIMYRTGDLGKLLSNNEIECLGRLDQQVKIRGHRIEPGEVEQALLLLGGIKTAVVLADENFLIAHIVPESSIEEAEAQIPTWREALTTRLPAQLIPHDFNIIEKIPTTLNGKIDRKELGKYKANKKIIYTAPRTEEENIVATIWKESLNLENIDIFSDFFEMGGHSIKGVKVMIEIEKHTGIRIPLSSLFKYSTVEKFAKLLNTGTEIYSDCLVPIKPAGNKVPLFIIHGAGLNVLNFMNLSKHFDEDQPIYGIQGTKPKGFDGWYESIEAMASHYIDAIIKVNPKGPYALAGFSFGGIVAFEMTRQLKERGKEVSLTGLLDSYLDSSYYYGSYRRKQLVRYFDLTHKRIDFLKEMLLSWKAFKMRINGKREYILQRHFGKKVEMTEQEELALQQFIEADRMVKKIVDLYHLKPQNFRVDLFRSKDDDNYKLDPTHLGWKKAALGGVTIHNISGNHLNIVAPPNDKVLARLLQDILDENHENL
ncbi:amino acid adenylation domain-containing protein [Flavobacterium nitrogenifigens]|uniref:Amino acid adenylation domain-containing protein n=2 Tax=Flavobacterium TaxID=237 RepID=A0A7W7IXN7_9FLAO|nr:MULTISPECIES: non-ribosomal peptide synthetase [Flavobacterium]MBB4802526.1 amino acid adenylation domain-containing protein [Flavobacterium nitrogenifigens]MBB6387484.1 amino acid adenylation domain-containing protein [Flavobacterium notoginsengisoli]